MRNFLLPITFFASLGMSPCAARITAKQAGKVAVLTSLAGMIISGGVIHSLDKKIQEARSKHDTSRVDSLTKKRRLAKQIVLWALMPSLIAGGFLGLTSKMASTEQNTVPHQQTHTLNNPNDVPANPAPLATRPRSKSCTSTKEPEGPHNNLEQHNQAGVLFKATPAPKAPLPVSEWAPIPKPAELTLHTTECGHNKYAPLFQLPYNASVGTNLALCGCATTQTWQCPNQLCNKVNHDQKVSSLNSEKLADCNFLLCQHCNKWICMPCSLTEKDFILSDKESLCKKCSRGICRTCQEIVTEYPYFPDCDACHINEDGNCRLLDQASVIADLQKLQGERKQDRERSSLPGQQEEPLSGPPILCLRCKKWVCRAEEDGRPCMQENQLVRRDKPLSERGGLFVNTCTKCEASYVLLASTDNLKDQFDQFTNPRSGNWICPGDRRKKIGDQANICDSCKRSRCSTCLTLMKPTSLSDQNKAKSLHLHKPGHEWLCTRLHITDQSAPYIVNTTSLKSCNTLNRAFSTICSHCKQKQETESCINKLHIILPDEELKAPLTQKHFVTVDEYFFGLNQPETSSRFLRFERPYDDTTKKTRFQKSADILAKAFNLTIDDSPHDREGTYTYRDIFQITRQFLKPMKNNNRRHIFEFLNNQTINTYLQDLNAAQNKPQKPEHQKNQDYHFIFEKLKQDQEKVTHYSTSLPQAYSQYKVSMLNLMLIEDYETAQQIWKKYCSLANPDGPLTEFINEKLASEESFNKLKANDDFKKITQDDTLTTIFSYETPEIYHPGGFFLLVTANNIASVSGDGMCGFRAISGFLKENDNIVENIRSAIRNSTNNDWMQPNEGHRIFGDSRFLIYFREIKELSVEKNGTPYRVFGLLLQDNPQQISKNPEAAKHPPILVDYQNWGHGVTHFERIVPDNAHPEWFIEQIKLSRDSAGKIVQTITHEIPIDSMLPHLKIDDTRE